MQGKKYIHQLEWENRRLRKENIDLKNANAALQASVDKWEAAAQELMTLAMELEAEDEFKLQFNHNGMEWNTIIGEPHDETE